VVRAVRPRAAVAATPVVPGTVVPRAVLPAAVAPADLAGPLPGGLGSDVDGGSGHGCTVLALVGAVGPVAARTALARASGSGFAVGLDGGGGSGSDLLRSGLGGRGGL